MGVYIKNMEMPSSCAACEWSRYSFPNAWCGITHKTTDVEIAKNGRPDNCPLVPVQRHGRLIDADALIADVRAHSESYFADDFAHEWVDVAPTVIPAEESEA